MRGIISFVLLVIMISIPNMLVESSQTALKAISDNFVKAYQQCEQEYTLGPEVGQSLAEFWNDGYTSSDRNVGCAIYCMSTKLELIDPEGKLHHDNLSEFAKTHGSDDSIVKKFVEVLHTCEQASGNKDDKCLKALDVALCFKKEMHALGWAPDPKLMMEEVIGEAK